MVCMGHSGGDRCFCTYVPLVTFQTEVWFSPLIGLPGGLFGLRGQMWSGRAVLRRLL